MAKVNVEFDTNDKTLDIVMDGQSLENVRGVEFWKDFDSKEFRMSLRTVENGDDGFVKVMIINANDELVEDNHGLRKRLAKHLFPNRMV